MCIRDSVEPHPTLRRQDTELFYDLDISISQASLGASVLVPTPDGDELVEVKPGTQPGTEIRLRGRGVPHLRRPGMRGDLHVMVDLRVPTRLSDRQRTLLEEFAAEAGESDNGGRAAPQRGRRGKRGLADRLKDAIS